MRLLLLSNSASTFIPIISKRPPCFTCQLSLGFEDLSSIAQNKVLVAATVSAVVGQLSKPFTSAFLYRKSFDLKAAVQSGGFPSSHSSAVMATATSLGLERGFSDSIFGLTVVYAALVMYDAQGVRREVGKHAETINKVLLEKESVKLTNLKAEEETIESGYYLYERVGHTRFEVLAGALLGIAVSFTIYLLT